ncbi:MAG TPA: hypothetical protein VHE37_17065, partial [Nevskiaceae bacterium]|nr:hypothetical protein [Nevskiaceae bacterium]
HALDQVARVLVKHAEVGICGGGELDHGGNERALMIIPTLARCRRFADNKRTTLPEMHRA